MQAGPGQADGETGDAHRGLVGRRSRGAGRARCRQCRGHVDAVHACSRFSAGLRPVMRDSEGSFWQSSVQEVVVRVAPRRLRVVAAVTPGAAQGDGAGKEEGRCISVVRGASPRDAERG
jgi:hypothetical protein